MKLTLASVLVCSLLLGGCGGPEKIVEGTQYPRDSKRGPTLDIQVIRHVTEIEMTNTSGRSFGPTRIWLNGRFSQQISGLAVGQTLSLRLDDFKDQFGEAFKGGGFFAIERSEGLALAEIEADGQVLGLIVIGGSEQ
jgi:hypothetical protein